MEEDRQRGREGEKEKAGFVTHSTYKSLLTSIFSNSRLPIEREGNMKVSEPRVLRIRCTDSLCADIDSVNIGVFNKCPIYGVFRKSNSRNSAPFRYRSPKYVDQGIGSIRDFDIIQ